MKKIYKIFMAVAAVAGVTACTTDATEDLGVNLNEGPKTLTLSLNDTRTQLGEKADGIYPLTWAEGDAISVNGYASKALTANEAGAASATFTFNGGFGSAPYFVAYPAVEGTTNQVVFAAEQTHTSNTSFGNNAAVMYGYTTDLNNIKLNHLTGVLKIGVVSGTATPAFIKEVRISTVDRKPIAGAFNVDAEGKLTPVKDATSEVITYKADGNAVIPVGTDANNPTYIHVTVPAGIYGELYVTLESADGVMYKTVTTDSSKPVNAGTVREFSNNIEFVPTDETETYVITNYYDLLDFQQAINNAQATMDNAEATEDAKTAAAATLAKSAVLVNDIEIPTAVQPGYEWAPINAPSYTGTIIGNGYAIKNLTTPLFVQTAASFKGLHLVANVEEESNPLFGMFARKLIANGNAPVIENCSVSGTITLNCKEYIPTTEDSFANASAGAFLGYGYGVAFKECTNYANFDIKKLVSENDDKSRYGAVAGFVAYANTENGLFVSFDNCHNKGNFTYAEGAQSGVGLFFGGLVGAYYGAGAVATFNNCSNSGNFTINANTRGGCIGGIIGYVKASDTSPKTLTFTNNTTNTGAIEVAGDCAGSLFLGGLVGNSTIYNNFIFKGPVQNGAPITLNGDVTGTTYIGGLFGQFYSECKAVFQGDVENTKQAALTVNGNSTSRVSIAGVFGFADTNTSQSTNGIFIEGATVTNNAALSINGTTYGNQVFLAGVVGSSQNTAHKFSKGGKFVNNGKLVMNSGAEAAQVIRIGGVTGYMYNDSAVLADASTDTGYMINTGDIEFRGSAKQHLDIGGIFGRIKYGVALTSVVNTGNIKAYGAFTEKYSTGSSKNNVRVGGIVGYSGTNESSAMKNVKCYCNIEAYTITKKNDSYTFTSYPLVGMVSGNPTTYTVVENVEIGGNIATTATVDNGVITPTWAELTETTYYDYVYGVRSGLTEFTGVSHLPKKPAVE